MLGYTNFQRRLFCALDESNHGRDEEIFVFAFTHQSEHAHIISTDFSTSKRRSDICMRIPKLYSSLDYRFCVVNRDHYKEFGCQNIPCLVSMVFIEEMNISSLDRLDLYIDGELSSVQRGYIKKSINKATAIPYPAIGIHSIAKVKNRDGEIKTNTLLTFADYQSNFLFHQPRYSTTDREGKYYPKRIPFP